MKRLLVVGLLLLGACGGESDEERQERIVNELVEQMKDARDEAFLDCLERANDNWAGNDPYRGCTR